MNTQEQPARTEDRRGAPHTSLGGDIGDSAPRRDIHEVQPGAFVDPVESLARAIVETAREIPRFQEIVVKDVDFDHQPEATKRFLRDHAGSILERLNR